MEGRAPPAARIPFNRTQSRPRLTAPAEEGGQAALVQVLQRDNALLRAEVAEQRTQITALKRALAAKDELIARVSATEERLEAALRRLAGTG